MPAKTSRFGTVITRLSGLLMTVLKIPTVSTVPATPAASTASPSLKGRKNTSMTPEATFASESRSAKPIARPAVLKITRKFVVGTPNAATAVSATSTSNAM